MGAVAAEIAPAPDARRHRHRRGLGQARGDRRGGAAPARGRRTSSPAHPLAGTEQSGPRSGFATLFDNRWCILVPRPGADRAGGGPASRPSGGRSAPTSTRWTPTTTTSSWRWSATRRTSSPTRWSASPTHLEQVSDSEVIKYSASGFRDFTRIAASRPDHVARRVPDQPGRHARHPRPLHRGAVRAAAGDPAWATAQHLHDYFTRTRAIRRGIIEAGQDTAAPDFGRAGRDHGRALARGRALAPRGAALLAGAAAAEAPAPSRAPSATRRDAAAVARVRPRGPPGPATGAPAPLVARGAARRRARSPLAEAGAAPRRRREAPPGRPAARLPAGARPAAAAARRPIRRRRAPRRPPRRSCAPRRRWRRCARSRSSLGAWRRLEPRAAPGARARRRRGRRAGAAPACGPPAPAPRPRRARPARRARAPRRLRAGADGPASAPGPT